MIRQTFFQDLINFLYQIDDVTLYQIKTNFPEILKIDHLIEEYVQAGYIICDNKHCMIGFELLDSLENVSLDGQLSIDDQDAIYEDLMALTFETRLTDRVNDLVSVEKTSIVRSESTLSNYLFRLADNLSMSETQEPLYDLLGDVNPQYALEYITTFLLKSGRKDEIAQKRLNIFVETLEKLDYIRKNNQGKYKLSMFLDKGNLIFASKA